jgi:hypothetical protein
VTWSAARWQAARRGEPDVITRRSMDDVIYEAPGPGEAWEPWSDLPGSFETLESWSNAQFAALMFDELRRAGVGYDESLAIIGEQFAEYGKPVPPRETLRRWVSPTKRTQTTVPLGPPRRRPPYVSEEFSALLKQKIGRAEALEQMATRHSASTRQVERWLTMPDDSPPPVDYD